MTMDSFSFLENKNGKYNFILNKIYAIVSDVKGWTSTEDNWCMITASFLW